MAVAQMASKPPELGYINLSTVVCLNLTSNTPATKNSRVLKYVFTVKGLSVP